MEDNDIDWALAMANENLIAKETLQPDETSSELLELVDELKKQNKHLGRKYKEQKRKYSELYHTIIDKKDLSTVSKDIRKKPYRLISQHCRIAGIGKQICRYS